MTRLQKIRERLDFHGDSPIHHDYAYDDLHYLIGEVATLTAGLTNCVAAMQAYEARVKLLEGALRSVIAESHSWVVLAETAFLLNPVHNKYRDIARAALEAE